MHIDFYFILCGAEKAFCPEFQHLVCQTFVTRLEVFYRNNIYERVVLKFVKDKVLHFLKRNTYWMIRLFAVENLFGVLKSLYHFGFNEKGYLLLFGKSA